MAGVPTITPTTRDQLQSVMDELEEKELKRFKSKLNQPGLMEGYNTIPKARLESADALDVVEMLISFYTIDHAVQVCKKVLTLINHLDLADRLSGV